MRFPLFIPAFLICLATGQVGAQMPDNDDCHHATVLHPGEVLQGENNLQATPAPATMQPETLPVTCVQSVENEMWYQFRTTGTETWYEVEIIHGHCNTPAGLQALLIETGSCDRTQYLYRACASFQSTDTIRLYMKESRPNVRILVWVDGYDGTLCDFSIGLKARKSQPDPWEVFRFNRFHFHPETEPQFEPAALSHSFRNNQFSLEWESPADEDVRFFVVERMHSYPSENTFAAALAILDPIRTTENGIAAFSWQDERGPLKPGEKAYYRILKVSADNQIYYSPIIETDIEMVEGFFLNEFSGKPENGIFKFHYLNFRKGESYSFELRDESGKVLKALSMKKEPVRDGDISLDMNPFPAGNYRLRMSAGKEHFERKFFWAGN